MPDIAGICLTHLDRDHFNVNWEATILRYGIRVFCAAHRVPDLLHFVGDDAISRLVAPFDSDAFEPVPGVAVSSLKLAHDREGSHGFLVDGFQTRLGYATDLGAVPPALIDQFCGVDLLAIESNYDPHMQRISGRPQFLQQRIMGGRGHLSNAESFAAVRAIFDRCQRKGHRLPQHVVLLHRSLRCNCPQIVRNLFSTDARIEPRLILSEQFDRTLWLAATPRERFIGEQLALAFA